MTTRLDLIERIAAEIAGRDRVGTVASGTATTAVLTGLANVTADDTAHVNDLLQMPRAASEADMERTVTAWDAEDGQATWVGDRADTTYSNETFILQPRPAYTLNEMRRSINDTLTQLQRTYKSVLPAVPDTYEYPLDGLTWLTSDGRVDSVTWSESPNTLHNEDFSLWHESDAPDGWTVAGAAARVSGGTWGPYAARLTRSTTDATLTQGMPSMLIQWLIRRTNVSFVNVYAGAWVKCSVADRARVGINDGSSTTWSSYHTGSGNWEWLTVSLTLSATVTDLKAVCSVDSGDTSADFGGVGLTIDSTKIPDPLKDRGSRAFLEYPIPFQTRNVGGTPVVELKSPVGHGRVVVWSRRTFAELDSDTATTDADFETVVSGSIMRMLAVHKPGQERTRLDLIMAQHADKYSRLASNLIDVPIVAPQRSFQVLGA